MILHVPGESVKQSDGVQAQQTSELATEIQMCHMRLCYGCTVFNGCGLVTPILGLGTAMCVNLHADHMYLVGSEEGKIYKCSKAFKDRYTEVYHVRQRYLPTYLHTYM